MIVYLDTSALVKLFVEEEHSDQVRQAVGHGRLIVTHGIAYVEACASFARLAHARESATLFRVLRKSLDVQWKAWDVIGVTEPLIHRAGDLAGRYRLRGYDSLHLAAAQTAFDALRGQMPFRFAVFDIQLRDAAKLAGLPLLDA